MTQLKTIRMILQRVIYHIQRLLMKKAPATKIDVDEEKLIGKLVSDKTIFSDEERAVIGAGGKVNLKLTVSDITESVSKEDKRKSKR